MTNLKSKIEWTDCTWNPTTGCTKVSPGCDNCYAKRLTERFHGKGAFAEVKLHHDRLDAPFHWRKPRRVFVNSMSDLFHDSIGSAFIAAVFDVMRQTPQHTYQILTKRHGRMRSLMRTAVPGEGWPLPNVWLGVSVEDEKRADLRIPALLETPAVVRFLSCEPLLGPVRLGNWIYGINWVIAGGESGPGARPMHPDWVRSLRDQCQSTGTAFLFKQWGGRTPKSGGRELDGRTWDEFPVAVAA